MNSKENLLGSITMVKIVQIGTLWVGCTNLHTQGKEKRVQFFYSYRGRYTGYVTEN